MKYKVYDLVMETMHPNNIWRITKFSNLDYYITLIRRPNQAPLTIKEESLDKHFKKLMNPNDVIKEIL